MRGSWSLKEAGDEYPSNNNSNNSRDYRGDNSWQRRRACVHKRWLRENR